jgi:hypothetical protein
MRILVLTVVAILLCGIFFNLCKSALDFFAAQEKARAVQLQKGAQ